MKNIKMRIDPSIAISPFIQFVHENNGYIEKQNEEYFVHITDKKNIDKEMKKLNKRLIKERKKIWKTH